MKKLILIVAAAMLLPMGMNARKKPVKKLVKAKTTKVVKKVKKEKAKVDSCINKSNVIHIEMGKGPLPPGAQPQ